MLLVTEPHGTPRHPVQEPAEPGGSAAVHTDIQLLPQQAGMASILATAVINSKWVTLPGAQWVTQVSGRDRFWVFSMQKVRFPHPDTCVHIHGRGPGLGGRGRE